jgi:hypothetical protein
MIWLQIGYNVGYCDNGDELYDEIVSENSTIRWTAVK